ncbi:neuropeptide CCHamide-1 receptor-like [Diadema setosum]|uniref:neuropeptide CCHamide-1 receptor-like n=1 Tax=Diadema setosum TaxID=31175 RepID=UPI003B3BDC14
MNNDSGINETVNMYSPVLRYRSLYIGCLMAELIIGMLANMSLIWLVTTVRDLRTPPSVLLTNQAIGDLCFLSFSMIPQLVSILTPGFRQTSWLCHLNHFTYFTSFAVSALSLMAISIERYCAIVIPLKFRQVRSLKATSAVCCFIWLLASTFGVYAVSATESAALFCTYPFEQLSFHVYFLFQLVFLYVIPVLCMTVFYGICARHLLRKEIRTSSSDNARVRVAINLMVITLVFTLCWLPHYVFFSWFLFGFNNEIFSKRSMYIFKLIRVGLYYFASCINPIILYAMSSSFRRHFIRKITCFVMHREGQESSQLSGRTYTSLPQQSGVAHVCRQRKDSGQRETLGPADMQMDKIYTMAEREDEKMSCRKHMLEDGV